MGAIADLFKSHILTPELKAVVVAADKLYTNLEKENRELRSQSEKSQSDAKKYKRQVKKLSE